MFPHSNRSIGFSHSWTSGKIKNHNRSSATVLSPDIRITHATLGATFSTLAGIFGRTAIETRFSHPACRWRLYVEELFTFFKPSAVCASSKRNMSRSNCEVKVENFRLFQTEPPRISIVLTYKQLPRIWNSGIFYQHCYFFFFIPNLVDFFHKNRHF